MRGLTRRGRIQPMDENASVTQLELFFDLVLVFAFTMVTDLASEEPTAVNMLRSLLVLAVLWWVWIDYAWLGNVVRADEGVTRVAMFVAMGGGFLAAITIPEAFDDLSGGWYGPLVFAMAYLLVRLVHLAMFWLASAADAQLRGQVLRWALGSITVGTTLLVIAAETHGTVQTCLWIAAIGGDYLWTHFAGNNWRLRSAAHFAERHGLIIIVALGESIVAIGIGVAGLPVSWPIVVAAMLGLMVSGLLWWAYFDTDALRVEHALRAATGARQIELARTCYTFWHFPMIVGIIALSLGLKKVLSYVGDESEHTLTDALTGIPLVALYGGVVLYLVGLIGFGRFGTGRTGWLRPATVAVLCVLTPLAAKLPALAALAMLCAVLTVLITWETLRFAETRDRIRHPAG
ncbi:low temperature requirement protein A [Nocardia testacea]|uniref:low temperature requirement protein A n=1 Tax=Nocardia testacea TaxID=248551 RepID=UPI003C307C6B